MVENLPLCPQIFLRALYIHCYIYPDNNHFKTIIQCNHKLTLFWSTCLDNNNGKIQSARVLISICTSHVLKAWKKPKLLPRFFQDLFFFLEVPYIFQILKIILYISTLSQEFPGIQKSERIQTLTSMVCSWEVRVLIILIFLVCAESTPMQ